MPNLSEEVLETLLAEAYEQGCCDTHTSIQAEPELALMPVESAEFGEAASDYAHHALTTYIRQSIGSEDLVRAPSNGHPQADCPAADVVGWRMTEAGTDRHFFSSTENVEFWKMAGHTAEPLYLAPLSRPVETEEVLDKIEGLEADLFLAVQTAYDRGAVEWARLNYPQWLDRLSANPPSLAQGHTEGWLPDSDAIAKAVCRERCAAYGDPPCFQLVGVDWDGGKCDNLHDCDCASITRAVLSVAAAPAPPSSTEGARS